MSAPAERNVSSLTWQFVVETSAIDTVVYTMRKYLISAKVRANPRFVVAPRDENTAVGILACTSPRRFSVLDTADGMELVELSHALGARTIGTRSNKSRWRKLAAREDALEMPSLRSQSPVMSSESLCPSSASCQTDYTAEYDEPFLPIWAYVGERDDDNSDDEPLPDDVDDDDSDDSDDSD